MKVIVNGGRNYKDCPADWEVLDRVNARYGITLVLSGGASGADAFGERWAESRKVPFKRFPADWERHGKAAGPIRNQEMVNEADLLVSFPGGRGTKDCVKRANKAGVPVLEVDRTAECS